MLNFPDSIAYQIYKKESFSSISPKSHEVTFENNIAQIIFMGFNEFKINEHSIPSHSVEIIVEGKTQRANKITKDNHIIFHLYDEIKFRFNDIALDSTDLKIHFDFLTKEVGQAILAVKDTM